MRETKTLPMPVHETQKGRRYRPLKKPLLVVKEGERQNVAFADERPNVSRDIELSPISPEESENTDPRSLQRKRGWEKTRKKTGAVKKRTSPGFIIYLGQPRYYPPEKA